MQMKNSIVLRVEQFLQTDGTGYRKDVLSAVLSEKTFTVDEMYEILSKSHELTRNKVASMMGYIQSKLGILSSHKESYKTPITYSLKEEYENLLEQMIKNVQIQTTS